MFKYNRFNKKRFSRNRFGGRRRSAKKSRLDSSSFVKKANDYKQGFSTNNPIQNATHHSSFSEFPISQVLLQNIEKKGYLEPTPIQDKAINPILEGRDLIGLANTGTGKTAAFLIPIINNIFKFRDRKALIITPTRELALQINEELRSFSQGMSIYSAAVIGGANMGRQIHEIRRNPHVVIATPGRLKDLIEQRV